MIYTKKANFPYPLLINDVSGYKNPKFELSIELKENNDEYIFSINTQIGSPFVINLLENKKAALYLVIKSKDNQFFKLNDIENNEVIISKSRISLMAKTTLQLMIQTVENVRYVDNSDLDDFYNEYRQELFIEKGKVLGFSSLVIFDGSQKNPFELFEQKIDESIKSDVEIKIGDETILIIYKNTTMQFNSIANHKKRRNLTNPYLYMGLQKALIKFILNNRTGDVEDSIDISELSEADMSPLNRKLLVLMKSKSVDEVSVDSIDEVIHTVSDGILKKYVETVEGLTNDN